MFDDGDWLAEGGRSSSHAAELSEAWRLQGEAVNEQDIMRQRVLERSTGKSNYFFRMSGPYQTPRNDSQRSADSYIFIQVYAPWPVKNGI